MNDEERDEFLDRVSGRIGYYNRSGERISLRQWAALIEGDPEYKIVRQTNLRNGWRVSTVWLGLDHSFSFSDEPVVPIIFETMIFTKGEPESPDEYQVRYSTEEQAIEGHERAVAYATGIMELQGEERGNGEQ